MAGSDIHGPDWPDHLDDPDRYGRSGHVYGWPFWALLALALALWFGTWLFSPAAAGEWRVLPAGRCVGASAVHEALEMQFGRQAHATLRSNGVTEYRRESGHAVLQLRWRTRDLCLAAWRVVEERGA